MPLPQARSRFEAVPKRLSVVMATLLTVLASTPHAHSAPNNSRPWIKDPQEMAKVAGLADGPYDWVLTHDVGDFSASVSASGDVWGMIFPKRTTHQYLSNAGFLFGCIRWPDTLVESGGASNAGIRETSTHREWKTYDPAAKAEQQFDAVFYDTTAGFYSFDEFDSSFHKPIGIEVHVTSYVWSQEYSRRFILIDYWIRNVSDRPIKEGCVGFHVDADVMGSSPDDDICGFVRTVPALVPGFEDPLNLAWIADNDGDPQGGGFDKTSITGVIGARILRAPPGGRLAFNWWAELWTLVGSPYHQRRVQLFNWGPFRENDGTVYGGSYGQPLGERSWYKTMINGEIDYDQVYTAIDHTASGWPSPPGRVASIDAANGLDTRFTLSYGPLDDIAPGDSVPFTVALIVGDRFHADPSNYQSRFYFGNPKPYLDRLDFSDLITNARWAGWLFDNPGVDSDPTDGNPFRGLAHLVDCDHVDTLKLDTLISSEPPETSIVAITESRGCDSVFYQGDGIPDFRVPEAPAPPPFQLTTKPGRVILHWNGAYTETFKDPISHKRDFEGYRVYVGRSNTEDQYTLLASWDKEDYKRVIWDTTVIEQWRPVSNPYSIAQWQAILQDTIFDPRDYREQVTSRAYRDTYLDTLRNSRGEIQEIRERERYSIWIPEDFNHPNTHWDTDHTDTNLIQRVAERDTLVDGRLIHYGVYELTLDNLQPWTSLYIAVTAFDYGDYDLKMKPLESPIMLNTKYGEPIYSADVVRDSGLHVAVFPNPYKIAYDDIHGNPTTYYNEGYEGAGKTEFTEYDRRIHFINLPDTATISIYSLDGDLIRTIHHPDKWLTTYSSSATWDLVSRNAMAVVSGIYIYQVTSRLGTQVGKIVIIK